METANGVAKLMDDDSTEFLLGSLVGEPAIVHGGIALGNVLCGSANVGPRTAFVEGDSDVSIALEVSWEEFEGQVCVACPFVGVLNYFAADEITSTAEMCELVEFKCCKRELTPTS